MHYYHRKFSNEILGNEEGIPNNENENENINTESNVPERKQRLQYIFKRDMKEIILKCICIVYFVIGITVPIVYMSQALDLNQENGRNSLSIYIGLMVAGYSINFILVIYNHYTNENMLDKSLRIKENLVLYIVVVPLMSTALIFLIIKIVTISLFFYFSKFSIICLTSFYFLFLIAVLILLLDVSRISRNKEIKMEKKYIMRASMVMTIIGLFTSKIWWLTSFGITTFKDFGTIHFNVTYYSNFSTGNNKFIIDAPYIYNIKNFQLLNVISTFLFPSKIALLIICIIILLEYLLKGFENTEENNEAIFKRSNQLKIPFQAVVIGVVIIIMPVLSILIIDRSQPKYNLIFYLIPCITYCLGIILSLIQIKEISTWKIKNQCQDQYIDKFLVWVGYFGQIIFIITSLSRSIEILNVLTQDKAKIKVNTIQIFAYAILLLNLLFLTIQITLQSIIVYLTLTRIYKIPEETSMAKIFCPSVGLFCLNVGCFFIISYMAPNAEIKLDSFSFNLFNNNFHIIEISFTLISRLHGCIFFGIFISNIQE